MAKIIGTVLAKLLSESEIALTNAEANAEIKAALAKFSYNTEKIAEGKALRQRVIELSDTQMKEQVESSAAGIEFKKKIKGIKEIYKKHRRRAKLAFDGDAVALIDLVLLGKQSTITSVWVDMVRKFYDTLLTNESYQTTIAGVGVTVEELTAAKALIAPMETAYSEFIREKGESEEATRVKDLAARDLELYMIRFWKTARIALEEKPQLLESLKIVVK